MSIFICQFCDRETTNSGANVKHEKHCKSNPNYVKAYRSPNAGAQKGSTPWNKGKKLHYTVGTKGKPGTFRDKQHTEETKRKMSESRKALYAAGWECIAGRCKKYDYESPIAGKIKLDGTWELKVATYLDSIGVNWSRNKQRFSYIRPDGKLATYQPDFYVVEWATFIEVKGYETELDHAKWSQFPHNIQVWKRDKIKTLEG